MFVSKRNHRADVPEAGRSLTPSGRRDDRQNRTRVTAAVAWTLLSGILAACGSTIPTAQSSNGAPAASGPVALRLGYLANITHAPALVGVSQGYFKSSLASNVTFTTQTFNAGPAEIEALLAGALDAAFVGPSPAINGYTKSGGSALRIVAGAASGGASLVIRPASNITGPNDLKGKTLATPQLGNTQDVALRAYLLGYGIHTDAQGGGDAKIVPTDNATTLQLFGQGKIDGAWVPEPWATRLVSEAGGKVLVDERSLWPNQQFATTDLVVAKTFLDAHPDTVLALIRGELKAIDWIQRNPTDAQSAVNQALLALTQKKLKDAELTAAWTELTFTADPLASTLKKEADNAKRVGLVTDTDISQILDLRWLNQALVSAGSAKVRAGGLGQE